MEIQTDIDLSKYTTFKIGGIAKRFAQVTDLIELEELIKKAKLNQWSIFVLGGGSNVLFSDEGFDGLVLRLWSDKIKIDQKTSNCQKVQVIVDAGVNLMTFVNFCKENGLTGMEWASGIPGTVGGAVRGNAGAFGGEMKDVIKNVKYLDLEFFQSDDQLELRCLRKKDCQFDYRNSWFKNQKDKIIWQVIFELERGDQTKIKIKMEQVISVRLKKQPMLTKFPSAGSFFKNPTVSRQIQKIFEKEKEIICKDNKIPAGWIIEKAGFKGKRVGGAMISDLQANFLVNADQATAIDVISLSKIIQQKIVKKFGVELEVEVQIV